MFRTAYIYCSLVEPYYHFEKWITSIFFGIHIVIVFAFIIGYLMIFTKYAVTLENKIKNESRVDQLTKLSNRYDLFNYLESIDDKFNYSLAILDIDDFKKINDTYGHICGDYILKEIARISKQNSTDCFVSRYGGEEFIVIVKTLKDSSIAYNQLERIRSIIENNDFVVDLKKNFSDLDQMHYSQDDMMKMMEKLNLGQNNEGFFNPLPNNNSGLNQLRGGQLDDDENTLNLIRHMKKIKLLREYRR